jgi:hypothetical protein
MVLGIDDGADEGALEQGPNTVTVLITTS